VDCHGACGTGWPQAGVVERNVLHGERLKSAGFRAGPLGRLPWRPCGGSRWKPSAGWSRERRPDHDHRSTTGSEATTDRRAIIAVPSTANP